MAPGLTSDGDTGSARGAGSATSIAATSRDWSPSWRAATTCTSRRSVTKRSTTSSRSGATPSSGSPRSPSRSPVSRPWCSSRTVCCHSTTRWHVAAGARRAPGPPQPRVGARRHGAGRAADHRRRRPVVPPRVGLGDGAARQLPDPARRVRSRPQHVLTAVAAVGSHARRVDRPAREPAAARPARDPVALRRRRPGRRRAHRAGGGSADRRRAARAGVRAARHGRHRLLRPCRQAAPLRDPVHARPGERRAPDPRPARRLVVGAAEDARHQRLAGLDDRRPVGVRVDAGRRRRRRAVARVRAPHDRRPDDGRGARREPDLRRRPQRLGPDDGGARGRRVDRHPRRLRLGRGNRHQLAHRPHERAHRHPVDPARR